MEREIIDIDLGDEVFCDVCNAEYTDSKESGGFMFGTYCYCPVCAKKAEAHIRSCNEGHLIRARCPEGASFADWVRQDCRQGESGRVIILKF